MPSPKYHPAQTQLPRATELMKMVGADLYIHPRLPSSTLATAYAKWSCCGPTPTIHSSTKLTVTVGADLYIRPNALRLQKQSIHSFRLWKSKPNGASDCSSTERYFRADNRIAD